MKRWIIAIGLLMLASGVYAQQGYQSGVGVRGGFVSGVTIKHFTDSETALEGILSFGRWGFNATGLYEIHARAFDVDRLNWYYGGGAHIGQWTDDHPFFDTRGQYAVVGLDGILGLEYQIEDIPFTISADWKPTINFTGNPGSFGFGGAMTVRYIF